MKAREAVLARVRDALGRSRHGPPPRPPRAYRTTSDLPVGAVVELLVERLVDYRARVHRCVPQEVAAHVGRLTAQAGSVVVPEGLERAWLAQVTAQVRTDSSAAPLSHAELDAVDAVVTAARVAVAETGTIVLDGGPDQGRRAISLVPDHHVCVLRAEQVVATVPEAVAVLDPTRPLTWIAGPSATSDIELVRVEGVHGPRTLDVVVTGG